MKKLWQKKQSKKLNHSTMDKFKYFMAFLLVLITFVSVFTLLGFNSTKKQTQKRGSAYIVIETLGNTTTEQFNVSGQSALELLRQKHQIETITIGHLRCIDGVCAENNYWWHFYVKNKSVASSVKNYIASNNDVMLFKFSNQ